MILVNIRGDECWVMRLSYSVYLNPPKNTPSTAAGLDGDEFGIVGASPTINSCHNAREDDLKYLRDRPKGFLLQILPHSCAGRSAW
jgi:hypothetical protein